MTDLANKFKDLEDLDPHSCPLQIDRENSE
jgi:aminoglycoside phosphotransferase